MEDGATLNRDWTTYSGSGIALACFSRNTPLLSTEQVEEVARSIERNYIPDAKIGLYKFPNKQEYSIDAVLVLPEESQDLVVRVAAALGQESVYNLSTGENIKTGKDGSNPMPVSPILMADINKSVREGVMPDWLSAGQQ